MVPGAAASVARNITAVRGNAEITRLWLSGRKKGIARKTEAAAGISAIQRVNVSLFRALETRVRCGVKARNAEAAARAEQR